MAKKIIDCKTLDCPQPVLMAKQVLEQEPLSEIQVIVDNDAAVENVSRFLNSQGFSVSVDSQRNLSTVTGIRDPKKSILMEPVQKSAESRTGGSDAQKILILISSQHLGKGDDELGQKLMLNFIKTLKEMGTDLWKLVFVNHGVKFTTKGSQILDELKELQSMGVHLLVCGACLTHLNLLAEKEIGETTNMLDIVTSMQLADKVLNF